jgi:hypothetical protein
VLFEQPTFASFIAYLYIKVKGPDEPIAIYRITI